MNGVSILGWNGDGLPALVAELRRLVDTDGARSVLIDMRRGDGIAADCLETLTEAATVCRERGCGIGMFGLGEELSRLAQVMGLTNHLPPVLGDSEDEALRTLRGDAVPAAPTLDFEIDLSPAAAAAPTTRFDPPATAPTARFDAGKVTARLAPPPVPEGPQPDADLLMINWTDLVSTGYQVGGPGADDIVAAAQLGSPTPAPTAAKPTGRSTSLGGGYTLEEGDEEPAPESAAGVFSSEGDFSPLDTGDDGPPAFMREAPPPRRATPAPQPRPATPPPAARPATPPPAARPATPPPAAQPVRPAASAPAQPARPPVQAPPARPAPAARTVSNQPPPGSPALTAGGALTSDDETVMFQMDADAMALLEEVAAAAAAATPPPAASPAPAAAPPPAAAAALPPPPPAAAPPAEAYEEDGDGDQTIMFQLGAFDAALLAEVAAAAGPEAPLPPPPQLPAPAQGPQDEEAELLSFLQDHALASPLHLQVLELLLQREDAVGPGEIHGALGGSRGAVLSLVEQLNQSRLIRRTRAPHLPGGVGFLLATSPAARGRVVRLVKLWHDPAGRATLAAWMQGTRAAGS